MSNQRIDCRLLLLQIYLNHLLPFAFLFGPLEARTFYSTAGIFAAAC